MMKRTLKFSHVLTLAVLLAGYGFSNAGITDIETAILKKDYERAQRLSQDVLSSRAGESEKSRAQYYQGIAQLNLNQYEKARGNFSSLTRAAKGELRDRAYLGLADSYHLEGRYAQALEWSEKLVSVSPKSDYLSLAYLKIARASLKLAQWSKANKYLNKIISEFPASMENEAAQQLIQEKQYFSVQVGSFAIRERAQNLVDELKEKAHYAYILEFQDKNSKKIYRVRVGQLSQLNEAENLKTKLAQLGYPARIYP